METIGERLEKLRKTLGLTQLQLARELGVTQQHISQVENGTRSPSDQFLKHVCAYGNTTMLWLVKGEGEMFLSPEEIIKQQVDRIGEKAYFEAVRNIINKSDPTIWKPTVEATTGSPDLDRMISYLINLWEAADEDIKAWARIQFTLAFPADIENEIEKKRTEALALPTLIHRYIIKDDDLQRG